MPFLRWTEFRRGAIARGGGEGHGTVLEMIAFRGAFGSLSFNCRGRPGMDHMAQMYLWSLAAQFADKMVNWGTTPGMHSQK